MFSVPPLLSWKPAPWQLGVETRTLFSSLANAEEGLEQLQAGGGDLHVDSISFRKGTATQRMPTGEISTRKQES